MSLFKKHAILLVLIFVVCSFSGCTTIGRGIGGIFGLLGKALSLATKVPWWMWI